MRSASRRLPFHRQGCDSVRRHPHVSKPLSFSDIALAHRQYLLSQDVDEMANGFHIHRTVRNGKENGIHCRKQFHRSFGTHQCREVEKNAARMAVRKVLLYLAQLSRGNALKLTNSHFQVLEDLFK